MLMSLRLPLLNASTGFTRRRPSPRSRPRFAQSRTSQRHCLERLHPPGARASAPRSNLGFRLTRVSDLEPLEALHAQPVAPARVDEDHQNVLAELAAKHCARGQWIHVQVLAADLPERSTGGACATRSAQVVRKDLAQHPRRRVAVQSQLSLVHSFFKNLRLVRISLS